MMMPVIMRKMKKPALNACLVPRSGLRWLMPSVCSLLVCSLSTPPCLAYTTHQAGSESPVARAAGRTSDDDDGSGSAEDEAMGAGVGAGAGASDDGGDSDMGGSAAEEAAGEEEDEEEEEPVVREPSHKKRRRAVVDESDSD